MENVITLGKLIGLLFCSAPLLYFVFENSKNTRNELARPVMGTIFNICMSVCLQETHIKNTYAKMRGPNYVAQTCACSKSVLGG